METIRNYLESMFSQLPNTPEVLKAKYELGQMMEDKYSELIADGKSENEVIVKCTLCQGHYEFFLFRFLLYICLLCRGIKVMPLIDCFHLLLQGLSEDKFLLSYIDNTQQVTTLLSPIDNVLYYNILSNP